MSDLNLIVWALGGIFVASCLMLARLRAIHDRQRDVLKCLMNIEEHVRRNRFDNKAVAQFREMANAD